ncbi:hypothetical protein BHF32_16960 [Escherichia coli]|nr:hypothetical protein BHF32_16960 [Escherichia coli]OEN51758.1 hypothetical protein BHF49_21145 [Escherichia coli]
MPVGAVNFATPAKTAAGNRRRVPATRQKFYVNRMGYGSTSGGRQMPARACALNRVDAVSDDVGSCERNCCV